MNGYITAIVSAGAVGLALIGCSDPSRKTEDPSGKKSNNPLGLLDILGAPVENPLSVGDVTSTAKDTNRRSSATHAHLWLALEDRDRDKWINTAGFGEGNKFDNYVEQLIANGRILPVPGGTRVKILELKPPPDKEYTQTYFRVEVLGGEYKGKSGWLSYYGLKHK